MLIYSKKVSLSCPSYLCIISWKAIICGCGSDNCRFLKDSDRMYMFARVPGVKFSSLWDNKNFHSIIILFIFFRIGRQIIFLNHYRLCMVGSTLSNLINAYIPGVRLLFDNVISINLAASFSKLLRWVGELKLIYQRYALYCWFIDTIE